MALRDHFRPPLYPLRHWTSFHNAWSTLIAIELNGRLPPRWVAEPNVRFGIEIDVGAFEEPHTPTGEPAPATWDPPAATATIDCAQLTDVVEVSVYGDFGGLELVGAIELVSPANKDRRPARDAFVAKCHSLLAEGVGLMVVDLVTERQADLHAALLSRLGSEARSAESPGLSATSYRPRAEQRDGSGRLDIWHHPLAVGGALPVLPLWLKRGPVLRVDLAETYERTCRDLRVPSTEATPQAAAASSAPFTPTVPSPTGAASS